MEEFYRLNPKLITRYQPFLAKRREKLAEDTHFDGWVFGQYMAEAIAANFSKRHKYPKKPYFEMSMEQPEEEEVRPLTDAERFQMFALAFNADHRDLPLKKELPIIDAEIKPTDSGERNVPGGE